MLGYYIAREFASNMIQDPPQLLVSVQYKETVLNRFGCLSLVGHRPQTRVETKRWEIVFRETVLISPHLRCK